MENFEAIDEPYARLNLEGQSAWDFGQRLFSRNIRKLEMSQGVFSLFLSAEGRIQEYFWVVKIPNGLILLVPKGRLQSLADLIEKYHFSEDFKTKRGGPIKSLWAPCEMSDSWGYGSLEGNRFVGAWRNTSFRFDLDHHPEAFKESDLWERHRIQNLIPIFGKDFDQTSLVYDMDLDDLCDAAKGCYIGQEVVERIRTHAGGCGPRHLAAMQWDARPEPGTPIVNVNEDPIGSTTGSIVPGEADKWLSLAVLRRQTASHADPVHNYPQGQTKIRGKVLRLRVQK